MFKKKRIIERFKGPILVFRFRFVSNRRSILSMRIIMSKILLRRDFQPTDGAFMDHLYQN